MEWMSLGLLHMKSLRRFESGGRVTIGKPTPLWTGPCAIDWWSLAQRRSQNFRCALI